MGLKLRLQNISHQGRKINLFVRDENNQLKIYEDNDFCPFYYEPDSNGKFTAYDGTKLRKVFVSEPKDIKKQRGKDSWASDLRYDRLYVTERIDEIIPSDPKIFFCDTEVLMPEFYSPEDNGDMP